MTSDHASEVKIAGHLNEYDFAELIGGEVNLGAHTDKKDVIIANIALIQSRRAFGGRYSSIVANA